MKINGGEILLTVEDDDDIQQLKKHFTGGKNREPIKMSFLGVDANVIGMTFVPGHNSEGAVTAQIGFTAIINEDKVIKIESLRKEDE